MPPCMTPATRAAFASFWRQYAETEIKDFCRAIWTAATLETTPPPRNPKPLNTKSHNYIPRLASSLSERYSSPAQRPQVPQRRRKSTD